MGFFDNLSKKATETYKNTTDKTSKMAREMKLKSYINENKNKINRIYVEIGKKVYEKHVEGNVSEIEEYIKPEIEQIEQTARKIENMNTEIRALNNLKLCKSCSAEIDLNARFCPKCGVKQEEPEEQKDEKNENSGNDVDNAVKVEAVYPSLKAPEVEENVIQEEKVTKNNEEIIENSERVVGSNENLIDNNEDAEIVIDGNNESTEKTVGNTENDENTNNVIILDSGNTKND